MTEDYWTTHGIEKPAQRIVCAANRYRKTGRIICGPRHWDNIMRQQKLETETFHGWDQGFVNQFGEFLTREEAHIIAKANGQIIARCGGDKHTLYSENLY